MTFLYPMRPGLTVPDTEAGREMLPKDWLYQVKLDDERAMVHASGVYTRFGKPFDKVKLAKFTEALLELNRCLRNSVDLDHCWLDVALVGYRKTRPPFRVVLLDIPTIDAPYLDREADICWALPWWEPGHDNYPEACRLPVYSTSEVAIKNAIACAPQCEGIIGRNPHAPYQSGDSDNMIKMRFKK